MSSHKVALYTALFLFYSFSLYGADHGGSAALVEIVPQEAYHTHYENSITYKFDLPYESTITHKVSPDYFFNALAADEFKDFLKKPEFKEIINSHHTTIGLDSDEFNLLSNAKSNLKYPDCLPHPQKILTYLKSADEKITKYLGSSVRNKNNEQPLNHIYWVHIWLVGIINKHDTIKNIQQLTLINHRPFDGTLDLTEFTKKNTPKLINLVCCFYIKSILLSNTTSIETIKFSPLTGGNTQNPLNIIIKKDENETTTYHLLPNEKVSLSPPPKPVVAPQNLKPKFNLINWFMFHKNAIIISFLAGAGTGAGFCYLWHNTKLKTWF